MKKYPSSIQCWDSNSRPLERESLPITTRPGRPVVVDVKKRLENKIKEDGMNEC